MTIYIDLDGTMLDIKKRYYKAYEELVGPDALTREEYWDRRSLEGSNEAILKRQGFSVNAMNKFAEKWLQIIESDRLLDLDSLIPEIDSLIGRSSENWIIITRRRSRRNLLKQLKKLGALGYFNRVINIKDKTKYTLKASDTDLVIGDTEDDIVLAKNNGLKSVAVAWGLRSSKELTEYRPDFICKTPSELQGLIESCLQNKKI